jgi:hypothetical protein
MCICLDEKVKYLTNGGNDDWKNMAWVDYT